MSQEVVECHPVGGSATENVSLEWTGFLYNHLAYPPSLLLQFSSRIWGEFAHPSWRAYWERLLCVKKAEEKTFPLA